MTRTAIFNTAMLLATLGVATAASAMCVGVPEANLRQGPGTRYAKSWTVYMYMPFETISQRGRWYRVRDVDGDIHWINRRAVTQAMRCAVVKVDKANVRTGPGMRYSLAPLSAAEKYYAFRVVGRQGDWVKVRDEAKNQGWIARALLWIR